MATSSAPPERCESRSVRGILDPAASLPCVTQSGGCSPTARMAMACRVLTPPAPLPPALLALTQQHDQPQREGTVEELPASATQVKESAAAIGTVEARNIVGEKASGPCSVAPVMSCSEASTAVPTASGSPTTVMAMPTVYTALSARARAPLPPYRWSEQQDETATEAPHSPRDLTPLGSSNNCISGPALHVIQGLQAQLVQALGELREERREREELAATVRKLNERLDAKEDLPAVPAVHNFESRRLEEQVATLTAMTSDWPERQGAMAASIHAVQQQVAELATSCTLLSGDECRARLPEQVRSLQAEKEQAAEVLRTIREQQQIIVHRLEQHEQQLASDLRPQAEARHESGAAEVQTLRAEIAEVASSMRVLHGMISGRASQDSVAALQTEVGAIANVVSTLTERVDRVSGEEPARLQGAALGPESACQQSIDTAETAQALRRRLAALVGEVEQNAVERRQRELPRGAEAANAEPLRQHPPTLGAWQLACSQAASTGRMSSEVGMAANRSAPSPRRWMMEPLAVSVARTGPEMWPALESI